MTDIIRHNSERRRFELDLGERPGEAVAFVTYRRSGETLSLDHSEVPHGMRGRGVGARLVRGVLEHLRAEDVRVRPACGFVARFISENPEFGDLLLAPQDRRPAAKSSSPAAHND